MNVEIMDLMEQGKYADVRVKINKMNPVDIAQILEELEPNKLLKVFRLLSKDIAAESFSYMSSQQQRFIVESISDKETKSIVDELFLDDAVDFLEEMPSNVVKKVLQNTEKTKRDTINRFFQYPDESAGSLMTIEFVDLKREMTVEEAIENIRRTGVNKETIDTCYVIDNKRILEGVVTIRTLILSEPTDLVKDIMSEKVIYVNTLEDQEDIAFKFKKYNFNTMPVVDSERRLVGIVTIDDIVDIIDQENTEDFQIMAAIQPSQESYLKTKVSDLARRRIFWLLILMISATFTGSIIRKYDEVLSSIVILASFIPMLMDAGGNSGSQSSTLIIRGLALGDIKTKDIFKVLWKELGVSLLVGTVLSIVNFARLFFLEQIGIMISLTVSLTLLFTVMLSKLLGGFLPILAKKLNQDPAIMAGPLITTIVDTITLMIYFALATRLLGI